MTSRSVAAKDVERELARARGSRRMLPWTVLSAMGAAAIGLAAGGGVRAAVALLALGLAFSAFVLATSVARCPACGARLPAARKPGERQPLGSCPRCLARFE